MTQVGMTLGAALEPERLYEAILEQVIRVVPCDHANVIMYDGERRTFEASWGSPRVAPGTSFSRGRCGSPRSSGSPCTRPTCWRSPAGSPCRR